MQAHFSRTNLGADLAADQKVVVAKATRLLQAAVDVISSSGWLNPALAAMELSQMVAQGMWDRDSPLLQLPHVTKELATKAAAQGCDSVFQLTEMEVGLRTPCLPSYLEQCLISNFAGLEPGEPACGLLPPLLMLLGIQNASGGLIQQLTA